MEPKWNQNGAQEPPKRYLITEPHFFSFLASLGSVLGSILAPYWDPFGLIFAHFLDVFFEIVFWSLWDPIFIDFGIILTSILQLFLVFFRTSPKYDFWWQFHTFDCFVGVRGSRFSHFLAIFFTPRFQTLFFIDFEDFGTPFGCHLGSLDVDLGIKTEAWFSMVFCIVPGGVQNPTFAMELGD